MKRAALLLVGSPKKKASTSLVLATTLASQLQACGWESQVAHVCRVLASEPQQAQFMADLEHCDCFILVFPLYIDCLPAPVVSLLEQVAACNPNGYPQKKLVAICNCGFPEASQIDIALQICRKFAQSCSFNWLGGLGLGMGGMIDGQELGSFGRLTKPLQAALHMTATAIDQNQPIPQQARNIFAKRLLPRWLYVAMGNHNWKVLAKKHQVKDRLSDQPYQ